MKNKIIYVLMFIFLAAACSKSSTTTTTTPTTPIVSGTVPDVYKKYMVLPVSLPMVRTLR